MFLNSRDILSELGQFITQLFSDLTSGLLFFGGVMDIIVTVLDIFVTALVIYYILKIIRDSRAWQLLKGLILIIVFAVACSLAGLSTVGFLLNNTISVLAIAFVVIFQPELRRALESFGRNSFNVLSSAITPDESEKKSGSLHNLIESIVRACEKLSETRTGGLIIIERQTRLGELVEQENVVQLDAAVSATILLQIFFKGSPLHDGAALIRDGRLTAARIHVPLSDNYHLRKDYGTRHRAAVGASEMGDAVAVVVSEERGSIGIAVDGRLYTLENADALRNLLHKLLGADRSGTRIGGLLRTSLRLGRNATQDEVKVVPAPEEDETRPEGDNPAARPAPQTVARPKPRRVPSKQRILLMALSLTISIVLWLYTQVTYNPVDSRTFTVPLAYRNVEVAMDAGFQPQVTSQNIQVTVQARRKIVSSLSSEDIAAYLDCTQIREAGSVLLEVQISTDTLMPLRPTAVTPPRVAVVVTSTR